MKLTHRLIYIVVALLFSIAPLMGQFSVAREWNEVLLYAIRNDLARPTVHARNLFHMSSAMYDAWAVYDDQAKPYFLGKVHNDFLFEFAGIEKPQDVEAARDIAISHACYNFLINRFQLSVGFEKIRARAAITANRLGININNKSIDYANGGPAELGNYLAAKILEFGKSDGANEDEDYENLYYTSVNPPMAPALPGNSTDIDPNRWQPLSLSIFIDQSGNVIPYNTPPFLGPEWGNVYPFSLSDSDKTTYERDDNQFQVYMDPGSPPKIGDAYSLESNEFYKWGFCLVSQWSSHLDTTSEIMWDISPASMGNVQEFPTRLAEYQEFYKFDGGDPGTGYNINPYTKQPYEKNFVLRSDFARVLAEFWADGPASETPPGHWFTLLNEVSESELLVKKFGGNGEELDELEWIVKAYFILGGAMHDSAVASWSIKGYYDYIRPVSAIRYLAEKGQCTDTSAQSFDPDGINLIEDYIELVQEGDSLAGTTNQHVGKIKLKAWKGPDYITNPETDAAGADWILAENWWPYQRPTFVTPNFAGYISGHSTFSRAAAEVLTLITGDPYFPGGIGEFVAKKNEFLVFEEGPTHDVVLQWATYYDAANQSGLSRIWGGIHPPADDIPGRIIGQKIGKQAYEYGVTYFESSTPTEELDIFNDVTIFPNPIQNGNVLTITHSELQNLNSIQIMDLAGRNIFSRNRPNIVDDQWNMDISGLPSGTFILTLSFDKQVYSTKMIVINE
jgi:hypothetical protein